MEELQYPLVDLAQLALDNGMVPIGLKNKRPILPRWEQTTVVTALRKIADCSRTNSCNNVGVLTGEKSGIVVVDVDVSRGGLEFWEQLLETHSLPETLQVSTPSGGLHIYFKYEPRVANLRNAASVKSYGIDLKNNGGQVVFIGSRNHETGVEYDLLSGFTPGSRQLIIAEMPDWLLELLKSNQAELDSKYPKKYKST